MKYIRRALVSVYDKAGLDSLAKSLVERGVEILSTGGTAKHLQELGIGIREVSGHTGFPEMLDGRVKTLHPMIHAGLLAVRDNPEHIAQTTEHGIGMIDLVVCNLYPFEATIAKKGIDLTEVIENIDIGGPTMIRSAAKNYRDVAVLSNPSQYPDTVAELEANDGCLSDETRFRLAKAAFAHTAHYDAVISRYLANLESSHGEFPDILDVRYEKAQSLRYGENPHQTAAFYRAHSSPEPCAAWANQLSGQELSYNNILDLEAAIEIVKDFTEPACAIIKHNNPCGLAAASNLAGAFSDALDCDRLSAFGCVIGLNREVDLEAANAIREAAKAGIKVEAIIAPCYKDRALKTLSRVKHRRILETSELSHNPAVKQIRNVVGGVLLQSRDMHETTPNTLQVVTKRQPTEAEIESLLFAWKACKHVKSNSIVLARGTKTVGIGAGQMSRVDASITAVRKAGAERAKAALLASDAYIPFPDNIEVAGEAGVCGIIQPGGSAGDASVIEAADRYSMAMVFTGVRHFRH
ncbi:MAG: bifunctional phosphoribosylaminoimidazolecarboxamide formyltransferase/IMP cyclohydrolase [Candidatus Poribacteria bacterium]|nr:bifunctional phosphoribosylaminoimidazolecarboxamide formyltransferase/IMP cyclohydrolase [Candidatus Poribacteria bacterium]